MTVDKEATRSEAIAAGFEAAEKKQAKLQGRIAQLTESIEQLQEELGRVMAGIADSASETEVRGALREAQE
jgi:vacuolar-type H+-ATPase subunit D/Vma8